jgi:GxxExxY protein
LLLISKGGEGAGVSFEREGAHRTREGAAKVIHAELSWRIVACAMKVHTSLGPGLLESAYEECLCHELAKEKLAVKRQVPVPLLYDGITLDCGFRLDLLVEDKVIVEVKSLERLLPVHDAQLLTYLKVTRLQLGILFNFNVAHLRNGMRRRVMTPNLRGTFAGPSRDFALKAPPEYLETPG